MGQVEKGRGKAAGEVGIDHDVGPAADGNRLGALRLQRNCILPGMGSKVSHAYPLTPQVTVFLVLSRTGSDTARCERAESPCPGRCARRLPGRANTLR